MGSGMGRTDSRDVPTPGLSLDAFTLPMALKADRELNYTTVAIGKWHLADVENGWERHPNRAGFDHYSGLIPGITASYFAWNKVVDGEFHPGVGYTPEDKADVVPADIVITDSVNFLPTLEDSDGPSPREWIYADVFLGGFEGVEGANYAIRDERDKLLRHEGMEEFYDLSVDPYEKHDLLRDSMSEAERTAYLTLRERVLALRTSE